MDDQHDSRSANAIDIVTSADAKSAVRTPDKRRPPSRKGKGPTPGSFKPGISGNPRGRPRAGLAFAEKVRERIDPDRILDLVAVVLDKKSTIAEREDARDRLAIVLPVVDRGFLKPPTGHALHVTGDAPGRSFEGVPLADLERVLGEVRKLKALPEPDGES